MIVHMNYQQYRTARRLCWISADSSRRRGRISSCLPGGAGRRTGQHLRARRRRGTTYRSAVEKKLIALHTPYHIYIKLPAGENEP